MVWKIKTQFEMKNLKKVNFPVLTYLTLVCYVLKLRRSRGTLKYCPISKILKSWNAFDPKNMNLPDPM